MIYTLSDYETDALLKYPETGMGYQIIEFNPNALYRIGKSIVINATLVIEMDNDLEKNLNQIKVEGFDRIAKDSSILPFFSFSKVYGQAEVVDSKHEFFGDLCGRMFGGTGAVQSERRFCSRGEKYVRISHFRNDKRIDPIRNKLLPGSFTTTYFDYEICVDCPDNPNDRYALPNNDKINWAFHILPKLDTVQEGIVQPANRKYGGGQEAFFKNGTSDDTLIKTTRYGEKN